MPDYKVTYEYLAPVFDQIVIDNQATEQDAMDEAFLEIARVFPEAMDIEVISVKEIKI